MSVAVIGSGAFGTALAVSLAGEGPVTLWSRSESQVLDMQNKRINTDRLPGVILPASLSISSEMAQEKTLLLAVPMQQLRTFLETFATDLKNRSLVAC